jgi:DtxR family Mn-dependent transcriptional regulator
MEAMLDHAATCPHGNPIPDTHGRTAESRARRLSSLERGQRAVIARIEEEKRDLLDYLGSLGMTPGCTVVVEQVAPFDGPLLLRTSGASYALGREIAQKVWVNESA